MFRIPVKTLSRKPFMLMLQDDSGVLAPVRLDPALASSQNAVIVLDEYNDTCWAWVGRNVSMPTRMHTLRMAKSVQKSGHKIKETNIGMASSRLVEMNEKDEGDPEVASNIAAFRTAITRRWRFDDEFLAYDESKTAGYAPEKVQLRDSHATVTAQAAPVEVRPKPRPMTSAPPPPPPMSRTPAARPVTPAAKPFVKPTTSAAGSVSAEKKVAFLLYSAVKNSDLVYTERFHRDGKMGVKIEAPGVLVIEALVDGENLVVSPTDFGGSEEAKRIKADYEAWLSSL